MPTLINEEVILCLRIAFLTFCSFPSHKVKGKTMTLLKSSEGGICRAPPAGQIPLGPHNVENFSYQEH